MNTARHSRLAQQIVNHAISRTRYLGERRMSSAFSATTRDAIQRIYVINLDRQPARWRQMMKELGGVQDSSGNPLLAMTRRYSAVDARYLSDLPDRQVVEPSFSLADQLFVEPNPLLKGLVDPHERMISMTRQEIAVALSHIGVWRRIAQDDRSYTLVLEDDVTFRRGFARVMDRTWFDLLDGELEPTGIEMLYVSYQEALYQPPFEHQSRLWLRPSSGLWQLSGYILSRSGAQALLDLLPVRGPVDLWLNHQFQRLQVYATRDSIVKQRVDLPSSNSYSVLPVLTALGVFSREKPNHFKGERLPRPVFGFGDQASGLSGLASALLMLGYRCCSDLSDLPSQELHELLGDGRGRIFDAYVNIGALDGDALVKLAKVYSDARFIFSASESTHASLAYNDEAGTDDWTKVAARLNAINAQVLVLQEEEPDKWELLRNFLGTAYPAHQYPSCIDRPRRLLNGNNDNMVGKHSAQGLLGDTSPWVIPNKSWRGLMISAPTSSEPSTEKECYTLESAGLDDDRWWLRDDTFPSNLALFRPQNLSTIGNVTRICLREEFTPVRNFTSGAIASRARHLYGRYAAVLKPPRVPGLVTGIFLHRDTPRQEIDIEFLGNAPTKLLLNVYFNPGMEGTKLEFGYRGTPTLIDLGFDATADFHRYEIEWEPHIIRWRVDGLLVHERCEWNPTPIPHLPMQFNANLWPSRSRQLAGRLAKRDLPAYAEIRSMVVSPSH